MNYQADGSVASVTVAYNEAGVLPRQMDALRRQKRPLQEIVVVDNASKDGTGRLLAERYPQVTLLTMRENLGVSGALAAGMAYAALEKGHDWVWTFDADSVPEDDTLETLLGGIHSAEGVNGDIAMAGPLVVDRATGECYPPLFWRHGYVKPSLGLLQKPVFSIDLLIGSGTLVRRDVVQKIGLPRGDFFMDFQDFEYCLRARSHGYKLAMVTRSRLIHEIGKARRVSLGARSWLRADHPPWREYYIARNLTYSCWWLYPSFRARWFALRHLVRHAGGVLLFGSNKLASLKRIAQGFSAGRRANLGIRFRPPTDAAHG